MSRGTASTRSMAAWSNMKGPGVLTRATGKLHPRSTRFCQPPNKPLAAQKKWQRRCSPSEAIFDRPLQKPWPPDAARLPECSSVDWIQTFFAAIYEEAGSSSVLIECTIALSDQRNVAVLRFIL